MSHTTWMIYGATGTTGTLIAKEAIRRGHQPVLAGRSAALLAALGKRLGLPWMAVGLDVAVKQRQVRGVGQGIQHAYLEQLHEAGVDL